MTTPKLDPVTLRFVSDELLAEALDLQRKHAGKFERGWEGAFGKFIVLRDQAKKLRERATRIERKGKGRKA